MTPSPEQERIVDAITSPFESRRPWWRPGRRTWAEQARSSSSYGAKSFARRPIRRDMVDIESQLACDLADMPESLYR